MIVYFTVNHTAGQNSRLADGVGVVLRGVEAPVAGEQPPVRQRHLDDQQDRHHEEHGHEQGGGRGVGQP